MGNTNHHDAGIQRRRQRAQREQAEQWSATLRNLRQILRFCGAIEVDSRGQYIAMWTDHRGWDHARRVFGPTIAMAAARLVTEEMGMPSTILPMEPFGSADLRFVANGEIEYRLYRLDNEWVTDVVARLNEPIMEG